MKSILKDIFVEKVAKMEPTWDPKWSQNGAKVVPRSAKDEKGGICKKCCTLHKKNGVFEGLGAAPGDGNLRKKRIRIVVKIKVDFEGDLGAHMDPKWGPKEAKIE